jgi:hypothetical protein
MLSVAQVHTAAITTTKPQHQKQDWIATHSGHMLSMYVQKEEAGQVPKAPNDASLALVGRVHVGVRQCEDGQPLVVLHTVQGLPALGLV